VSRSAASQRGAFRVNFQFRVLTLLAFLSRGALKRRVQSAAPIGREAGAGPRGDSLAAYP